MENILEIKQLNKSYGNCKALKGVSLSIPSGCITGLLGPNGSGKTTLMKIITGLILDYEGSVSICGQKPGGSANPYISYLPDRQHIPDWLKVSEAVGLFADFYGDFDKSRAISMLDSMSIPTEKKIKALSKGMQEKLQLSLIMSRRAKLYVLDEPIAAVDPAARDFIMKTILSNCDSDSSIIISTHIIADIEPALDKAIFLKDGEIYLEEDAEAIRGQYGQSLDQMFREAFKC